MFKNRESFCVRIDINCQTIYISNSNTNVFPIVKRHNDDKCFTVSKAGNSFYEIFVIQKCLQSFQICRRLKDNRHDNVIKVTMLEQKYNTYADISTNL